MKSHVGRSPRGATLPSTVPRHHYNYSRSLLGPGREDCREQSTARSSAPSPDSPMLYVHVGGGAGARDALEALHWASFSFFGKFCANEPQILLR